MAAPWRCGICIVFLCLKLRELMNHINVSHASSPHFVIKCGVDGCPRSYRKYHSFYKHVVSVHNDRYIEEDLPVRPPEHANLPERPDADAWAVPLPENDVNGDNRVNGDNDNAPQAQPEDNNEINLKTWAAKFICGLKERNCFTQAATNDIVQSTVNLVELTVDKFKKEIFQRAANSQLEGNTLLTLKEIVDESELAVSNPFDNLDSAYLQDLYVKRNFLSVKLREVNLGETIVSKRKGTKYHVTARNDTFVYVPLLESMRQLISNVRVQALVTNQPKTAPDGYYFDMFDGEIYQNHNILCDDSISIVLYFDEIDICNPLGSRSGIHKLGMFYYSIANIDTKFRSKLETIQLLAIARSENIKKYGINAILEPFVQDLQLFRQGCDFKLADDEIVHLKGALLAAVGDTPASHALGGFKESVGVSFSKCRYCNCGVDDMSNFTVDHFQKRNLNSHLEQLIEIERADTEYLRNHLCTMYGINRRSILLDAPAFDVCTMLPQDIMHVVIEGISQYEVKEVLKELISKQKLFGLSQLNTFIRNFHLPYFEVKNKPSEIIQATLASDDSRLRQSASQMHVFLKILPFFLASTGLETDNPLYLFIIELLSIINILHSPLISSGSLVCLNLMIKNHLETFVQLFPEHTIMPKQHFMIHFPETIRMHGPPIRYSCMRYEAKHNIFKQLAQKQNFLNLPKSIAERHLKAECMFYAHDNPSSHPLFSTEQVTGPCKMHVNDFQDISSKINEFYRDLVLKTVHSTKHITLYGTKYTPDECMIAVEVENNVPSFGLLKNVFIVETDVGEQEIFFAFKMYETSHFEDLLQAYVIEEPALPEGCVIRRPRECLDFGCYYIVKFRNEMFIPLNYDLMSVIELANEGYPNFLQA